MSKTLIDFEWQRDSKGYRLANSIPKKWHIAYSSIPGVEIEDRGPWIVPNEGIAQIYRPLEQHDLLFKEFAEIKQTPQGVLNFIQNYGFLTRANDEAKTGQAENVAYVLAHAKSMQRFLNPKDAKLGLHFLGNEIKLLSVDVTIINDRASRFPRLKLSPQCLLDALWLQLAQSLTGGININTCQHCGGWFKAGSNAERRSDAKFCSEKHRILYNSQKRTPKTKAKTKGRK